MPHAPAGYPALLILPEGGEAYPAPGKSFIYGRCYRVLSR